MPLYNPVTEFAPINLVADVPFVMVVPPTLPARTVQEFIALAKNSPNKLTFGSVGVGTPQHLGGELFKMHAGVDLIHVPFRGATAAIPDLLAGRIDMFIGAINSLLPLIKEGKLRALAAAGGKRIDVAAGRADLCRGGLARRRGRLGRRARGAGRHAARHRRHAQPRDRARSSPRPAFTSAWRRSASTWSAPRRRPTRRSLSDDYEKWGKVVAAAGIKPE